MGCLGAHFAAAEFEVGSQDEALFVFEDVFAAGHVWGMYWAGGRIKRTGGRGSEGGVGPEFALADDGGYGVFHSFGRVAVLFEEAFYHPPHACPGGFFFLPVDGSVFLEEVGEFAGYCDEFFVFVEVFDCFGFCQGVVECGFFDGEAEFFPGLLCGGHFFCHAEEFFDDLFVCDHSVYVGVHGAGEEVGEPFRLYEVCPLVYGYLVGEEAFEEFDGEVLFLHFCDFVEEFFVEEGEFLFDV